MNNDLIQNSIISEKTKEISRITDFLVLRCWLIISAAYMLTGMSDLQAIFTDTTNRTRHILVVVLIYSCSILAFVYRGFYEKLSRLRIKDHTSSAILLCTTFSILFIAGLCCDIKQYVYSYALVMLIVTALYQNTLLVCVEGAVFFISYLVYYLTLPPTSGIDSQGSTFALIMLAVAIVCAIIATRGLKKSNHLQTEHVLGLYKDSVQNNEALVKVKNRVKEDVISVGDKIHTNRIQTDNMSISIQEVTTAIESFASSLQEINLGTVSIQDELSSIGQLSSTMSDLSKDTNSLLLSSEEMLNATITKSSEVNQISGIVISSMDQLANNIKDIELMVNVIKEVASQTSLLSLNASIEAARAGEAGRGFSVVAEEIRKLSDSTNDSVNKIETMMQSINESVTQTTSNIDSMKEELVEQTSCVDHAQASLQQSKNAITDLLHSINLVTDAVMKVSNANKSVVDSTTSISALSEEIAANTESISTLSVEIANEINNIDQINTKLINDF